MIISILISVFVFLALLSIYDYFNLSYSKVTQKNVMGITKLYSEEKDLLSKILNFLENRLLEFNKKHIDSEIKKEKIEKLRRAGIEISYEKHLIQKILIPIVVFIFFFLLGALASSLSIVSGYIFKVLGFVLAIAVYKDINGQIERKMDELRTGIIMEMPSFISTYRCSPDNKTLVEIIDDYKGTSNYLKYDLNLLKTDISQFSTEKALKMFSHRININEVDEVVAIFINDLNGDRADSKINLELVESRFIEKYQNYIENKLKNRPTTLEFLGVVGMMSIISIFLVVVGYGLFEGLMNMM